MNRWVNTLVLFFMVMTCTSHNVSSKMPTPERTKATASSETQEDIENTCAICLTPVSHPAPVQLNKCKQGENHHYYHEDCINEWLKNYQSEGKCPTCQKKLVPSDIYKKQDRTPLYTAANKGNLARVQELLAHGYHHINERSRFWRWTPLHIAIYRNYKDIVQLLVNEPTCNLESRVDYVWADSYMTPLELAIYLMRLDIIDILIAAGADIQGALFYIFSSKVAGKAQILKVIQKLISAGANIHAVNRNGNTPLHLALLSSDMGSQRMAVIQELYEAGANIHARNNRGQTPLHIAAQKEIVSALIFLINKGADINSLDNDRKTPYDLTWGFTASLLLSRPKIGNPVKNLLASIIGMHG